MLCNYPEQCYLFSLAYSHGFDVWKQPYVPLGWSSMVNLRADQFERAMHVSIGWADWSVRRMYALSGAAVVATEFMKTFQDYPQRQQPGNFNVEVIMYQLEAACAAGQ